MLRTQGTSLPSLPIYLANIDDKSLYVAVTRARKQLWFMEPQENSIDPILKTLSQSNSLELAEFVKQKDPNVSILLINITIILVSSLSGCVKGYGSAGRWLGGPREVA